MIGIDDLINIPFTPDLTESGITYACRSLPHSHNRTRSSCYDTLRRTAAGVVVELAFRRYLAQQNVPFDVKSGTPFTDPDHYDVSLGGRRCDLKSFLISRRSQITALHADPGLALNAPALVPLDRYAADGHTANNLYLFAFLTGLIAASSGELKKAATTGLPSYLIHAMPAVWVRPRAWIPLGPLALKSEADETLIVEVAGQDAGREFITRSLFLPPHTRCVMDAGFYSLAYLHVKSKPGARLGVFSPSREETYLIKSTEWSNIWIYGMDIYLTGWISRSEFRQRASLVPEGSRVFQYERTRTKNLAVPISDLKPLAELFDRVREWKSLK
jgi:hypothetical protein